ncbi:MAG TPA: flagellar assembly protein FliX [Phenylobacterium sp.]|nr:flagellar assembly protein FliX [Phenylobacterium sp.]
MKVNGTSGVGSAGGPGRARPAGDGQGFRLPAAEAAAGPAQAARASSLSGVMSVDAILALQDVGGPMERKRRAVRRAGRLLDVLDEVKIGLLSGELSGADIGRLQEVIRDQRDRTDDPELEGVLNEIETRAAVELAKLEQGNHAS